METVKLVFCIVGIIYMVIEIIGFFSSGVIATKIKKALDGYLEEESNKLEKVYYNVDQLRGEVERLNRSVNRIECKMGNYHKEVREHFNYDNDMYNKNLDVIAKDIQGIYDKFELLNQQSEKKKEDNSAFWGALSGVLSGVLSSALMKGIDGSKESSEKTGEQTDENVCYAVRKKGSEEWLDQKFNSIEEVYSWMKENGITVDDYDIGRYTSKPEETQE